MWLGGVSGGFAAWLWRLGGGHTNVNQFDLYMITTKLRENLNEVLNIEFFAFYSISSC